MQAINFWNQFLIHRQKVILLAGICVCSCVNGQHFKWARRNNPEYDQRKITYGFSIGLHTSAYQVKYSEKFVTPQLDTVHSVMAPFSPGFSLGFLVNFRFHDVLDLRLMPKAGFYDHKLIYNYTDRSQREQLVETTMVEFPVLLKYKSARRGNVRMYIVGGFTPGFEASGKNDVESITASLGVRNINMSWDAGLGFDFYFPLFKLSNELRFTRGIANMLNEEQSKYKDPIQRLNTNTIAVYFIFQ